MGTVNHRTESVKMFKPLKMEMCLPSRGQCPVQAWLRCMFISVCPALASPRTCPTTCLWPHYSFRILNPRISTLLFIYSSCHHHSCTPELVSCFMYYGSIFVSGCLRTKLHVLSRQFHRFKYLLPTVDPYINVYNFHTYRMIS